MWRCRRFGALFQFISLLTLLSTCSSQRGICDQQEDRIDGDINEFWCRPDEFADGLDGAAVLFEEEEKAWG